MAGMTHQSTTAPAKKRAWLALRRRKPSGMRRSAAASARATGLEPATSGVTGRRSNQLNYARWLGKGSGRPMPRPALFSAGFTGPLHPAQGRLGGLLHTSSLLVAARGPGTPRRGRAAFWADPQRQRESDVVKRPCPIPASFSPPDV